MSCRIDYKMKKYYYITFIAIVATVCLQAKYSSEIKSQKPDTVRLSPQDADMIRSTTVKQIAAGKFASERIHGLEQDILQAAGFPLNLNTLDSLWRASDSIVRHPHQFFLYDKDRNDFFCWRLGKPYA